MGEQNSDSKHLEYGDGDPDREEADPEEDRILIRTNQQEASEVGHIERQYSCW